jgi:phosphoribosylformimino-5-aminoimidazole carboxamide ribotide isomerase
MEFRPCIDLHDGVVKQIVGVTLGSESAELETNFEAEKPPEWYAALYREDRLFGGHIVMLGPGNEDAATAALGAFPGGMQVGGGISLDNAASWLDRGASAVIVTSYVFHDGKVDETRLEDLSSAVGRDRLVLDLSCKRQGDLYKIVTNRWQTFTDEAISPKLLSRLGKYCGEFLVHAVDVEGRSRGIEAELTSILGEWAEMPITYAGGIGSQTDVDLIETLGKDQINFTVGTALDIFGGPMPYKALAAKYGPTS